MNIEMEIQEIKRRLDRLDNQQYLGYPYGTAYAANLCPKCGITLEKIMMYSCQISGCPNFKRVTM